ncbi:MAG: hypothetical protein ACE5G9_11075 [Nitrospinales bacterium]
MGIIYDILLTAGEIVSLILVAVSFLFSALILFKPALAARINSNFKQWFPTNERFQKLETEIQTTETIIKYRWLIGLVFFLGAVYTIYFLLVGFDQSKFIALVIKPETQTAEMFTAMIMDFLRWLLVIWCVVGAALCLILTLLPERFRKLSQTLDAFFSTQKVQDLIDTSSDSLDQWVLKNHVLVGFFLFMGSSFLAVFCLTTWFVR